jgi:hypothetical protein
MDDFSSIGQPQRLFDIVTLAITLLWRRKPGLAPNGTHFDCGSSDSLGFSGFLRF